MIIHALILSLKITAIHVLFQEGMILGWLKIIMANAFDVVFDKKWSIYLQKPLYECIVCMASVWTLILTPIGVYSFSYLIGLMLIVCGINAIISKILDL